MNSLTNNITSYFYRRWCYVPRQASMAGHGRSPDSAHSSDPWCYDYTYNDHGPTAKADIIMITNQIDTIWNRMFKSTKK